MVEYKLKRGAHTVTAKFEFTAPESEWDGYQITDQFNKVELALMKKMMGDRAAAKPHESRREWLSRTRRDKHFAIKAGVLDWTPYKRCTWKNYEGLLEYIERCECAGAG